MPGAARAVDCPTHHLPPRHPNVGRELAADFVAQPQASFGRREPGTETERLDLLEREIQRGSRLEYEPLGEEQLVFRFQASCHVACVADEGGRLHLEPVRCEPLHPDDDVGPGHVGRDVLAHPKLCRSKNGLIIRL